MRVELLDAISRVKWAIYPFLVRFTPRLAIAAHEPESTGAWWRAIKERMIVVDGGANLGGYSMLASKRAGASGRIYAFEPEPDNFAQLVRRVREMPNVVPVQKALGRSSGEAQLHLDRFHARHSLTRDGSRTITVPVTTLDEFVRDEKLAGVDVVKLDIEGAELEAIAGMTAVLTAPRRPVVLCELHPPHAPEQFRDALAVHGYRCELLDAQFTGAVHHGPVHILATPA
jgi:FkbM family methyltransferase